MPLLALMWVKTATASTTSCDHFFMVGIMMLIAI